jgi:hypothetical protein
MNGVFEQAGGMGFEGATMSGSLPCKLGLNFRPDVNDDRHGVSPFSVILLSLPPVRPPYPATYPGIKQKAQHNVGFYVRRYIQTIENTSFIPVRRRAIERVADCAARGHLNMSDGLLRPLPLLWRRERVE